MPTVTWARLDPTRRAAVIEAAEAEFGAHGFSRGSLNVIARRAGVAKGSLFQYFADKRDLLLSTLRAAASRTTVRFEAAIAEGGDLQAGLEAWLPLDEQRLTDWRVIIAFWGVAVSDPELAEVQDGHVTRARARVEKLLRQDRQLAEKPSETVRLAQQVVALSLGIALQAVFESAGPTARAQRTLLADGLSRLTATAA